MTTKLRFFLLPISTRRTLIYCEHHAAPANLASGQKPPISERVVHKAATTWAAWEKADKGWQKQLTTYGNAFLRRIPYEEWGLKSIPPGTDKKLEEWTLRKDGNVPESKVVQCLYPGGFIAGDIAQTLRKLATERQALHRRRLWTSIALMPVVAPFALVPIIPNIPFFYLCFRAYSHYKAWFGGKFLEHLDKQGIIRPEPCARLEELYAASFLHPTLPNGQNPPAIQLQEVEAVKSDLKTNSEEVMLLRPWSARVLAEHYAVPEMQVEIERAVDQVEAAIKKEKNEAAKSTSASVTEKLKNEVDVKTGEVKR
ncbi:Hypothetical protein R9X50_00174400 [Acrodontium crateriforme]|uniref:Mitochondrial K+-H+ exchange-related-domain-containing protein n=1 Tax=Acrodontium crateriforme TaxID=150365 RepID=A0AAQ3M2K1_9PEZI|nr:Hypothetical protein R9X50_00174400 [Acrodontium crateriforme]